MKSVLLLVILVFIIMLWAPVGFGMILIPSQMFQAIGSLPLTMIPFFMLTGELMTSATITDRLVDLSQRIIGRMRGSAAQAIVLVRMIFRA